MSDGDQFELGFDAAQSARDKANGNGQSAEGDPLAFLKISGPLHRMMDSNFLRYASYVIRERAIPALGDGLKPVQRRILHALFDMDDGRFIKVANVVGHTMQYHPHGDASIEDALVTLTNKRYLIEGQGNFGNLLTGDRAAASRYIECRLTELARNEVFNKHITDETPSYDGRRKEPVTLPVKLPLLLMLGAEGIAVGLATRILPHNFKELLEAQIAILQKKPFQVLPDFQQGGLLDASGLEDGVGTARVRARMEPRGNHALCIYELPFGVTTEAIISSIEDAVRKRKVPVKSITDYTAENVEILLDLKPETTPLKAMEALYAFSQCEVNVSSRIVAIDDNQPRELTVPEVLRANTEQLVRTLQRELEYRHLTLMDALHAKTLVQIFVEQRIYKAIEDCKTYAAITQAIHKGFEPYRKSLERALDAADIEMLLAVRIRRITLFDIERHQQEIGNIRDELKTIEKHLSGMKAYAVRYLKALIKKYGNDYPRRTEIQTFEEIEIRELTADDLTICYDESNGYLGARVEGTQLMTASPYDKLVVVWQDGRFKMMPPPDKLFVDKNMVYCSKADREQIFTLVYTQDGITYIKRFSFGGFVMNKEYRCAGEAAEIHLFEEGTPDRIFVKYKKVKNQRISQQAFEPANIPVKSTKARGNQMTVKKIDRIATKQPRWWNDAKQGPKGVTM